MHLILNEALAPFVLTPRLFVRNNFYSNTVSYGLNLFTIFRRRNEMNIKAATLGGTRHAVIKRNDTVRPNYEVISQGLCLKQSKV